MDRIKVLHTTYEVAFSSPATGKANRPGRGSGKGEPAKVSGSFVMVLDGPGRFVEPNKDLPLLLT